MTFSHRRPIPLPVSFFSSTWVSFIDLPHAGRENSSIGLRKRAAWWKVNLYELLVDVEALAHPDATVKADMVPNHDIDGMH